MVADTEFILTTIAVDRDMIRAAPRPRLLHKWGIRVDKFDLDAARATGVPVAITFGSNAGAVSEHLLTLMLATYRRLARADRNLRDGFWLRPAASRNATSSPARRLVCLASATWRASGGIVSPASRRKPSTATSAAPTWRRRGPRAPRRCHSGKGGRLTRARLRRDAGFVKRDIPPPAFGPFIVTSVSWVRQPRGSPPVRPAARYPRLGIDKYLNYLNQDDSDERTIQYNR
jgi:hypothetical protein